jgi:predicted porin
MKKTLLALAIAGAAVSAQADVTISGHVSYAIGNIDDFSDRDESGRSITEGNTSTSRFRIIGTTEANGITYGAKQEIAVNTNSPLSTRVNEIFISGDFGKVSLGQGSESSDDAAELDFSGTYLAGGDLDSWNLDGDADNDGADSEDGLGFSTIDGGRTERLRYDSPKIGGIAQVSFDTQDDDDFVVRLALSGNNWKAALYSESRDADNSDEIGGSVAAKFGGFTAAYQFADRDSATSGGPETDYDAVILGYRVGKYAFSIDSRRNETSDDSVDTDTQGLSFVYRPTGGVELFAGLRTVENNITNDDADGFLLGGRVKF